MDITLFFKLKRTKVDILFSEYIRERANWSCERCYLDCNDDHGYLDCSHYWSRGKKSVRFDPENAAALCKKCHHYFTDKINQDDHDEFFLKRLGQTKLDLLAFRAHKPQKVDEKYLEIYFHQAIKDLKRLREINQSLQCLLKNSLKQ